MRKQQFRKNYGGFKLTTERNGQNLFSGVHSCTKLDFSSTANASMR